MNTTAIIILLLSSLIGLVGYWLRIVHTEFKQILSELTTYTHELKQIIVGIQTQIDKGIEADIQDIKSDIKNLYKLTSKSKTNV